MWKAAVVCSFVVLCSAAALVSAAPPLVLASVPEDWSDLPPATPSTRRATAVRLLTWNQSPYLFLNTGNGLKLYSISDPASPVTLDEEIFVCWSCSAIPPGDYDWVLFNFSVCDDCRWGVAHFWQAGLALFDLGTAVQPAILPTSRYYNAGSDTQGAFTFSHGGSQYLIINRLISLNPGDFPGPNLGCDLVQQPTLLLINGLGPNDLTEIGCVDPALSVTNGLYLPGPDGTAFLYLIDRPTYKVHIFELSGSGADLSLTHRSTPFYTSAKFGTGMRADSSSKLLVTAVNGMPSARIWDISDPGTPVLLSTLDQYLVDADGLPVRVARAAIRWPLLWLGTYPSLTTFTFDITDPSAPQPVHQEFWDLASSWNSTDPVDGYPYLANSDAELTNDGSHLILARHSAMEVVATSYLLTETFESGDFSRWSHVATGG